MASVGFAAENSGNASSPPAGPSTPGPPLLASCGEGRGDWPRPFARGSRFLDADRERKIKRGAGPPNQLWAEM